MAFTAYPASLGARVTVVSGALAMAPALLELGFTPAMAIGITLCTLVGGAEVACRLTAPYLAPGVRITVLVVIIVVVVQLLSLGYEPAPAVATVLLTALGVAEVSRRLTGESYRIPRLTY